MLRHFLLSLTLFTLTAGVASAAPTWSGSYLGVLGGGSSMTANVSIVGSGKSYNPAPGATIGGVIGGFNWQQGTALIGLEAEYDGILAGSPWSILTFAPDPVVNTVTEGPNVRVRARFGVSSGPLLFFAAGGWSQSNVRLQLQSQAPFAGHVSDQTNTLSGYNAGAGFEYALSSRAMGRIEYIYDHYGNTTFIPNDTFFSHRAFTNVAENTYRATLTLRL